MALLVWMVPVIFLWQRLIRHLSIEWTLNPRYGYGWAVPALCGFLIWRELGGQSQGQDNQLARLLTRKTAVVGALLAAGYAPLRLIQEANPDWRFVSWGLGLDVLGLTLLLVSWLIQWCQEHNRKGVPHSLFPYLFFLTAIPWPTFIESRVVTALTEFVTFGTDEILYWIGVPALVQGNMVEVAVGRIRIEEGCSGIRSLQAAMMIALFVGQLFGLRLRARFLCLLVAGAVSVCLNLARTVVLATLAAEGGAEVVKRWHDLVGIPLQVGLYGGIWLVAWCFRGKHRPSLPEPLAFNEISWQATRGYVACWEWPAWKWLPAGLTVWLVSVEVFNQIWYRERASQFSPPLVWKLDWPRAQSRFHELQFSASARRFLRFDEGSNATWLTDDGLRWQAMFLCWKRNCPAGHLAGNHTPEDCLVAGGYELAGESCSFNACVNGLELAFNRYTASDGVAPVFVFYCLWDDGAGAKGVPASRLTYCNRLSSVLAGRRSAGQRSLEMILWGAANEQEAQSAFEVAVRQLIRPAN